MKRVKGVSIMFITTILLMSVVLWGISHTFIAKAATVFPEGSTIGGIHIGGKTSDEAVSLVLDEIENWKKEGELTVRFAGQRVIIPYESITFDIQHTVKELEEKVKKSWYEIFKKASPRQIPLNVSVTLNEEILSQLGEFVDIKQTKTRIEQAASLLGEHEIEGVHTTDALLTEEVIAETTWTIPGDEQYLQLLIDKINGFEIPTNTRFSFNEQVANRVSHFGQKEGNFIASMLYTLVLQSNLEVVERTSQGEIPSYAEAGLEAYVQPDQNIDLVLYNPGPTSYKISVQQADTKLHMAVLSIPVNTSAHYTIENETDVKFPILVRYDNELKPGHVQVLQEGQKGKRVEVYKIIQDKNGNVLSKERIARDFYLPKPKVVLKSPVAEDVESKASDENDLTQITEMLTNHEKQTELLQENLKDMELTEEQLDELCSFIINRVSDTDEMNIPFLDNLADKALADLVDSDILGDKEMSDEERLGWLILVGLLSRTDDQEQQTSSLE